MKKIGWIAGVLIIIVLIIVWLSRTPSKAKINYKPQLKAVPTAMEYIRYDSKNISFAYQNKYTLRENEQGDIWQLVGNGVVPAIIVITLKPDKTGNIEDVSGVKMRRVKNSEYKEEKLNNGVLFTKNNPLEMTYFELKNGKSVTVAMTVNLNDDKNYRDELLKIIDTIIVVTGL